MFYLRPVTADACDVCKGQIAGDAAVVIILWDL